MPYLKALKKHASLHDDEAQLTLDTGEEIALSIERVRDPATHATTYIGRTRVLAADGSTLLDAQGQPLVCEVRHTVSASVLDALGDEAVTGAFARALLGEPPAPLKGAAALAGKAPDSPWSEEFLHGASIRSAIKAGKRTGHAKDLHKLL